MDLANWLVSISRQRWPVLPATQQELKRILARHSDFISFPELANLTLSDPFLLVDLLRLVGSSQALQRSETLPPAEKMLMMVGLEGISNRYRRITALEPAPGSLDDIVIEAVGDWLGRARVGAFLVKEWLSLAGEYKVEDCFIAAEVYNLPACLYLISCNHLPAKPLLQQMSEACGQDYPKILEFFVRQLPLPTALLDLLGPGAPSHKRQLLKLAMATANGLEQGWWRPQWQLGIEMAAKTMGRSYADTYSAVIDAVLHVARQPVVPGYAFAARALLALEGEVPRPTVVRAPALSAGAQQEAAVRETVRHLANDLKFQRVLFYRFDEASHTLRLRYQVGLEEGHLLRRMIVGMEEGSFFGLLTGKAQSFHASASLRAQLARRYQDPFLAQIGDGEFAAMSLFAGDELLGVFVVDHQGQPIVDADYHRFKALATRLAHTH